MRIAKWLNHGRCARLAFAGFVIACATPNLASAQFSTGGFSAASGGVTSGSSGRSSSSGTFGSRSLGGSSLSRGASSFGGTQRGAGVAGATTQDAAAGQISGNERFLRSNRQGGAAFVGADSGDTRSFFSALGAASRLGNQNIQRGQDNNNGNNPNAQQQRKPFRLQRVIAFEFRPAAPTAAATTISQRFNGMKQIKSLTPIDVTVQDRTAILRGVVATEHDRELLVQLASLEAGISNVQNELRVAPNQPGLGLIPATAPTTPQGLPAAPTPTAPQPPPSSATPAPTGPTLPSGQPAASQNPIPEAPRQP